MKVIHSDDTPAESKASHAIALGVFDGVHLGHQSLLQKALEESQRLGVPALAFTFDPHPAQVVAPQVAPKLLESLATRLERFEAMGMKAAFVQKFTPEFASVSAEDFVHRVLLERLGVKALVVGDGFRFGHRHQGNTQLLAHLAGELGFALHTMPTVSIDGVTVSSTRIRGYVHNGQMRGAESLLGRPFEVQGEVVHGAGRGQTIGVATCNIEVGDTVVPKIGVYAGFAHARGERFAAVINVGHSPTFGTIALKVEAHLLDYEGKDFYGEAMRVSFLERLRDEQRFRSSEALVAQIKKDIIKAKAILSGA